MADTSPIFFEKQAAALCGRHALNNLLQGAYFTEIELADIARELDESEKQVMLAGGASPADVAAAFANGSTNVSDSGDFSITVLREALRRTRGLDLESDPKVVTAAVAEPQLYEAFLLNHDEHWFAVRKLPTAGGGKAWFNLNSLQNGPEAISDFFLSAFLSQMKADGYSIFVVTPTSALPPASKNAWEYPPGTLFTVAQALAARSSTEATRRNAAKRAREAASEDPDLAAALAASLGQPVPQRGAAAGGSNGGGFGGGDDDDADLRAALAASLADSKRSVSSSSSSSNSSAAAGQGCVIDDDDDDDTLRRAVEMSMAAGGGAASHVRTVDVTSLISSLRAGLPAEPSPTAAASSSSSSSSLGASTARIQVKLPSSCPPLVAGAAPSASAPNPLSPATATRQRRFAACWIGRC